MCVNYQQKIKWRYQRAKACPLAELMYVELAELKQAAELNHVG